MKKKLVGGLLCLLLAASSIISINQPLTAYAADDVTGITLEKEMRAMINRGVMNGYDDGSYQPFTNVSRGQFAALISRALQLSEGPAKFPDVPSSSKLASGINSASAAGIVNGYADGTFGMSDLITRDQMAKMIDNALVYLKVARKEAPLSFQDASEIGGTFKQAVAHAVYDEIVKGIPLENGGYNFVPKKTATRAEAAAFIYRMLRTAYPEYNVASIDANQNLIPGPVIYSSFAEANNAVISPEQVITRNDEVVKMAAGMVISSPVFGSQITNIYKDQNFSNAITYVNANQEMEYLESTNEYVKINIAGTTAYVKHREVSLIPTQQSKGRSYYEVDQARNLNHYVYNPADQSYESYISGKAPSFLSAGNHYYSWDGGVFYDANGTEAGTAFQYFNYLPARTVTNYSAEELDRYTNNRLAEVEASYNSNPVKYKDYKDATKISKIIGLGSYIKEAEAKYKINGLLILSIAMHESKYGMSAYAQERNNLFGLNAVDSNPDEADFFDNVNASIDALATAYLNKNYINPLGSYANGAVLGNKSQGFNVKYASDPYWGQKIAGHMYRVDKFLGGKDFGRYKIGETISNGLNVRSTPDDKDGSNIQFTYKQFGMPVAILESTTQPNGSIWYKIVSDHIDYNEAYIYSLHVKDMPIVQ